MGKPSKQKEGNNTEVEINTDEQQMDLQDTTSGSSTLPTDLDSSNRDHPDSPQNPKESKKARRERLSSSSISEVIAASALTEQLSSVTEIADLKILVAKLVSENSTIREEVTSIKNNSSVKSGTANYGFFDTVLLLESATDVTKAKVSAIISQMRNPIFKRPLDEIIFSKAKRFINFDFLQHGYAKTQSEIDSWTDMEYIDMLEKFFQNVHLDATSLSRFSKIKMGGLFVSGKISPALINSLLEADELQSQEERLDPVFQRSLIQRAVGHLSPLEPARIKLTSDFSKCKTFKEFLLLWTIYRNQKQVIIDELTADGYVVLPKSYILSSISSNADKPLKDKKDKLNNAERSASSLSTTIGHIKLDPKYANCNGCGRQEFDAKQKAVHDYSNCFLRLHPNWNNDPLVKWKDSTSGKAFAALNPPFMFLPYTYLKDGSKRDLPEKGKLSCIDCNYLVSLKNNFLKSSSNINFLSLTLVSVQLPSQERVSLKTRSVNVRGLLDSGSLAGDFISQDIVDIFDLNSYITQEILSKKVCSGLDNSCSLSVGSLTASVSFINEITIKSEILILILKILKNSPIDLIIGRESISCVPYVLYLHIVSTALAYALLVRPHQSN
jgi:hypothetical protein